jgi:hypothetical protein
MRNALARTSPAKRTHRLKRREKEPKSRGATGTHMKRRRTLSWPWLTPESPS